MCNFNVEYVRWCGMHTLNLGLLQTMLGSTLRILLDMKHWGDISDELQLKAGYLEFTSWARRHKIPPIAALAFFRLILYVLENLGLKLCSWVCTQYPVRHSHPNLRIHTTDHYPIFQCKAYNAAWLERTY